VEKGSKTGLRVRQAFVVTFAAATMHVGCNKTRTHNPPAPNPDPTPTTTTKSEPAKVVSRADGRCYLEYSMSCPPNARCNPPEPEEIDCPAGMGDASAPKKTSRRPPGKEDWLRLPSHIYANRGECSFGDERFCAPPPKKTDCTPAGEIMKLKCTKLDAGRERHQIESFVYKDFAGTCHKVPSMECPALCEVPEGEIVPCS